MTVAMTQYTPDNFFIFLKEAIWSEFMNSMRAREAQPCCGGKYITATFEEGLIVDLSGFKRSYLDRAFTPDKFEKNADLMADRFIKAIKLRVEKHKIKRMELNMQIICHDLKAEYHLHIQPHAGPEPMTPVA